MYCVVREVKRDTRGRVAQRFGVMPDTGKFTMWYPTEKEALDACRTLNGGQVSDVEYRRVRGKGE